LINKVNTGASFSFIFDGKHSQGLLPHWKQTHGLLRGGREAVTRVTTYTDPATGLEVSNELTAYPENGAVECLVRLRNTGAQDTPIIEKILALDLQFTVPGKGKITLHSAHGSLGTAEDYLPLDNEVTSSAEQNLAHYVLQGSKHVGGQVPFFNLEWQGGGLIGEMGWSGQWAVRIGRDTGRIVTLQAGQQTTHLKLHPGESIRTPRILLLQWSGNDPVAGHNQLRRVLLAHYVPRIGGKPVIPPVAGVNQGMYFYDAILKKTGQDPLDVIRHWKLSDMGPIPDGALNWVNEQNQLEFLHNMPPVGTEVNWIDAGWFEGAWPFGVGSWVADPKKFPHGLKQVGDATHAAGMKFLVWFEPGRVGPESSTAKEHAAWILHQAHEGKWGGLFNYGDPQARQWMTDLISNRIGDWGIDIFRHDSNICPLPFWQAADSPDRQGISENHWVEGLYNIWDELLRRHPGLMIDNANWRITGPDIEAMSRSVGSLTRSEVDCSGLPFPIVEQAETEELSLWVPVSATGVNELDPYSFRSAATNGVSSGWTFRAQYIDLDALKHGIDELKSLRLYWYGDYYPLSKINLDEQSWAAWQFDRPDLGGGFAVFFRRPKSEQPRLDTGLRGLDRNAKYEVSFFESYDVKDKRMMTGAQLAHLPVTINSAPGSMLVRYWKVVAAPASAK